MRQLRTSRDATTPRIQMPVYEMYCSKLAKSCATLLAVPCGLDQHVTGSQLMFPHTTEERRALSHALRTMKLLEEAATREHKAA